MIKYFEQASVTCREKMVFVMLACALALAAELTVVAVLSAQAASDLELAPNLSFHDDSSPNFPIRGAAYPMARDPGAKRA